MSMLKHIYTHALCSNAHNNLQTLVISLAIDDQRGDRDEMVEKEM